MKSHRMRVLKFGKYRTSDVRSVRAFTLVELLVVLMVSGIVLLSIFGGIAMTRRLAMQMTEHVNCNLTTYGAYSCLVDLTTHSDSVAVEGTVCAFFRNGSRLRQIEASSLIDGLLDIRVVSPSTYRNIVGQAIPDTLKVTFDAGGSLPVIWRFAIRKNESENIKYDEEYQETT